MDMNAWNSLFGVLQLLLIALATILWRQLSAVQKRADETARELAEYKTHVAETYITSNELSKAVDSFNRAIDAVFKKLERIDEKLDRKADKP